MIWPTYPLKLSATQLRDWYLYINIGGKIYFKILGSVNEDLLRSAPISIITKQGQSFETYSKNINGDSNVGRHINKIDHLP